MIMKDIVKEKYMDSSNENLLLGSLTNDKTKRTFNKISTISPIALEFHGINQKGKAIQIQKFFHFEQIKLQWQFLLKTSPTIIIFC